GIRGGLRPTRMPARTHQLLPLAQGTQTTLDRRTETTAGTDPLPDGLKLGEGSAGGFQSRWGRVVVEVSTARGPGHQFPQPAAVVDPGFAPARWEDFWQKRKAGTMGGRNQVMQPGKALGGGTVARPGAKTGRAERSRAPPQAGPAEAATIAQ